MRIFLHLILYFIIGMLTIACEKEQYDAQDPTSSQSPPTVLSADNENNFYVDLYRSYPEKVIAIKAYELTNRLVGVDKLSDITGSSTETYLENHTSLALLKALASTGVITHQDATTLNSIMKIIMSDEVLNASDFNLESSIAVQTKQIIFGQSGSSKKETTITKNHNCESCLSQCRASNQGLYNVLYNQEYERCRSSGQPGNLCAIRARLVADGLIDRRCNNSCEDECTPEPCTDCPPGYTYDGANCYSGVHYPSGYEGFIWSRNFYTKRNCSISTANNCCPSGYSFDGANCYSGKWHPSGWDPFIWQRTFYVKAKCL